MNQKDLGFLDTIPLVPPVLLVEQFPHSFLTLKHQSTFPPMYVVGYRMIGCSKGTNDPGEAARRAESSEGVFLPFLSKIHLFRCWQRL